MYNMNIQRYTHIHAYMYTHTYIHIYIYVYTHTHKHIYTHTYIYILIFIYIHGVLRLIIGNLGGTQACTWTWALCYLSSEPLPGQLPELYKERRQGRLAVDLGLFVGGGVSKN